MVSVGAARESESLLSVGPKEERGTVVAAGAAACSEDSDGSGPSGLKSRARVTVGGGVVGSVCGSRALVGERPLVDSSKMTFRLQR